MVHKVGVYIPGTEQFWTGFVRFDATPWVVVRSVTGLLNGYLIVSAVGRVRESHGAVAGSPHTEYGATRETVA
jgi:hypothetical protein